MRGRTGLQAAVGSTDQIARRSPGLEDMQEGKNRAVVAEVRRQVVDRDISNGPGLTVHWWTRNSLQLQAEVALIAGLVGVVFMMMDAIGRHRHQ